MTGKAAPIETANFGFLAKHDVQLMSLGALAERYFWDDPNTSLIKLRSRSRTRS
jgi:type I restriction enzyme, R subunit